MNDERVAWRRHYCTMRVDCLSWPHIVKTTVACVGEEAVDVHNFRNVKIIRCNVLLRIVKLLGCFAVIFREFFVRALRRTAGSCSLCVDVLGSRGEWPHTLSVVRHGVQPASRGDTPLRCARATARVPLCAVRFTVCFRASAQTTRPANS